MFIVRSEIKDVNWSTATFKTWLASKKDSYWLPPCTTQLVSVFLVVPFLPPNPGWMMDVFILVSALVLNSLATWMACSCCWLEPYEENKKVIISWICQLIFWSEWLDLQFDQCLCCCIQIPIDSQRSFLEDNISIDDHSCQNKSALVVSEWHTNCKLHRLM